MRAALALSASLAATCAMVQDGFDPAGLDLAAIVACEADVPAYSSLAFRLEMEPDAIARLGWTERESGSPLLREFALAVPVEVFGHSTARIAFFRSRSSKASTHRRLPQRLASTRLPPLPAGSSANG